MLPMLPRLELVVVGVALARQPAANPVTRPIVETHWPMTTKTRRHCAIREGMVGINWKTVLNPTLAFV